MSTVTQDEYGVVFVHRDDGSLHSFMSRSDYDQIRASLGSDAPDPTPITSGGGILYGIPRNERTP